MSSTLKLQRLRPGIDTSPRRAHPVQLGAGMPLLQAAQEVLGEMFEQFTRNLHGMAYADDPELVHQARVAWRRWRSATRLFRPHLPTTEPTRTNLQPLLAAMGQLRDLDVARTETLPRWLPAFAQNQPERERMVEQTQALLQAACQQRREQLRQILATPATGVALLAYRRWLCSFTAAPLATSEPLQTRWVRQRINRLHRRLQTVLRSAQQPDADAALQHQARLLAKRTRYSIEAFNDMLPGPKVRRWTQEATAIQHQFGTVRDAMQAAVLLAQLKAPSEVVAFMEGVATGQMGQKGQMPPAC